MIPDLGFSDFEITWKSPAISPLLKWEGSCHNHRSRETLMSVGILANQDSYGEEMKLWSKVGLKYVSLTVQNSLNVITTFYKRIG